MDELLPSIKSTNKTTTSEKIPRKPKVPKEPKANKPKANKHYTQTELVLFTPSAEQQLIIDAIKRGENVAVNAVAGSGKTTTLYATLKLLNKESRNILTVEDPVEYTLEGINQVQFESIYR